MTKKKNAEEQDNVLKDNFDLQAEEKIENNGEREEKQVEEISIEDQLKAELKEMNDKYLRLYSEFDNYRKRTQKERIETIQTASKNLITELIPVLDDFDRTTSSFDEAKDIEAIKEGVQLVYNKTLGILKKQGFAFMEIKEGADFDPELHEAITKIPAPNKKLKGKIVDVIERGCTLNDKVLRFPKVVIGE